MSDTIKNNSEILFIYDAKMCNPNGDPDDENKPRMDYDRNQNIVSDVRLKRYLRDYISNHEDSERNKIFVTKIEYASVNAKKSLANILGIKDTGSIKLTKDQEEKFLKTAIDVRMFGSIIPDVKFSNESNATYTGPIQFNWGYSLNKVTQPFDSSGITSHFQTGKSDEVTEGSKSAGAMGKDYRVAYSIIAFHGIVNAKRAEMTYLSTTDLELFDRAMVRCIPLEATSRSKEGQEPLLYIRVEYNSNDYFIGDLRKYLKLADISGKEIPFENSEKLDRGKYQIDLSVLVKKLTERQDNILKIHYWKSDDIGIIGWNINEENDKKKLTYKNDDQKNTDIEVKYVNLKKENEKKNG